jgi:phospholipid transport system substrate-binding protein
MKGFLRFPLVLVALLFAAAVLAAAAPQEIVQSTTDNVLARVQAEKDQLRADPAKMYGLVSELIFPHFDFAIMSQWVLGDSWGTADEATRDAFVLQFRKLLVRTYATALLEFSDQAITYPATDAPAAGATTAIVKQQISQPGSAVIPIVYRLHNKSGDWKVFDVSVDGVSLVKTYRASFGSLIQKDGLAGLIQSLDQKNQEIATAQ